MKTKASVEERLREVIASRQAKVGVIGLGYVGLPLAAEFAKKGFAVPGFDVNPERARQVQSGRSYIPDVPSETLAELIGSGRLKASAPSKALGELDALIFCVPTPLRKSKDPDVSHILSAVDEAAKHVRGGQLIVLESTTYPGTTRELVLPRLEARGLKEGTDFFLAFSPERVDPGNPKFKIPNTPKIVGGVSRASGELAAELYRSIVQEVVVVSSAEAAEMVKLLENTFRAVNIALINEVALMCHRLGLDVWEIVDAAKTKPFGFMPFYPGPGLGGHCIPVDPYYLAWKMKSLNFEPRFIELAGVVNGHMPEHVIQRSMELLNEEGKALKGSEVLILGAAYKENVSDVRESPALDVVSLLAQAGARVSYHDAFVPKLTFEVPRSGARTLASKPLTPELVKGADLVLILTGHHGVDYAMVLKEARLVFDTRNVTRGVRRPTLFRL